MSTSNEVGGYQDQLDGRLYCELCGAERVAGTEIRELPPAARAMMGQVLLRLALMPPGQRDALCSRLADPGLSLRRAGIAPRSTAAGWLAELETMAPGLAGMLGGRTRQATAQRKRREAEEKQDCQRGMVFLEAHLKLRRKHARGK